MPPGTGAGGQQYAPGDRVSHFTIDGELGRGAMAVVYRATDARSGAGVALKAPRADAKPGVDSLRRLLREVRTSARLAHPHIVRLLGAFEHDGRPWIVMELVEGGTLAEALDRGGVFCARDVARCGQEIASALAFAHDRGVLHGDVSPGNILIAKGGSAKLADLGLARLADGPRTLASEALSTFVGAAARVAGTLPYIAPEVLLGGSPDPRSDLFSLGAVLYEMAAGRPIFPGDRTEDLQDAILNKEPAPVGSHGREIPADLERIVVKALARDLTERYPSAEAMEADLRAVRLRLES